MYGWVELEQASSDFVKDLGQPSHESRSLLIFPDFKKGPLKVLFCEDYGHMTSQNSVRNVKYFDTEVYCTRV